MTPIRRSHRSLVCGGEKALWVIQPRTGVMMMMKNRNPDYDRCNCVKMVPWSSIGRNLCIKKLSSLKKKQRTDNLFRWSFPRTKRDVCTATFSRKRIGWTSGMTRRLTLWLSDHLQLA